MAMLGTMRAEPLPSVFDVGDGRMRLSSPDNTLPGPSSRNMMSSPHWRVASIDSTHRTGAVSCSVRRQTASLAVVVGWADALAMTGKPGSPNCTAARASASPGRFAEKHQHTSVGRPGGAFIMKPFG